GWPRPPREPRRTRRRPRPSSCREPPPPPPRPGRGEGPALRAAWSASAGRSSARPGGGSSVAVLDSLGGLGRAARDDAELYGTLWDRAGYSGFSESPSPTGSTIGRFPVRSRTE